MSSKECVCVCVCACFSYFFYLIFPLKRNLSGPNFSLLNDSKCNYSDYHVTSSSSSPPPPHNFNRITGYVFRNYATESKKKEKKRVRGKARLQSLSTRHTASVHSTNSRASKKMNQAVERHKTLHINISKNK